MSQFDFGTIDPATKSGVQLASDLMAFRDAIYSSHRGIARPTYAQGGMIWVREVSASLWHVMLFTGTLDIQIAAFNPTNGVLDLTVAGATFTSIPQLPAVDPDSANDAVRKAYVDAVADGRVSVGGDTMDGALFLPPSGPTGANEAARKGYVDSLAPSAKISVLTGSWSGTFDLLVGTPTTFFDIMLPANTSAVLGSGWLNGVQTGGAAVTASFQAVLLNEALVAQATNFFSVVSNAGGSDAWFGSGGRVGFNGIAANNTGWRVRFQGQKDAAQGPLNLLAWEASILCVRR